MRGLQGHLGIVLGRCLTLALLCAAPCAPVWAKTVTQEDGSTTVTSEVTYEMPETYELSIPASADVPEDADVAYLINSPHGTIRITANSVNLGHNRELRVTLGDCVVNNRGDIQVTNTSTGETTSIRARGPYKDGGSVTYDDARNGQLITAFRETSTVPTFDGEVHLYRYHGYEDGDYVGTVTFKMEVVSVS